MEAVWPVAMTIHTFSYSHRLHQPHEFNVIFQNNDLRISHPAILMLAKQNALQINRLGIVVSKKVMAKAVMRNGIKRQIRESFRQLDSGKPCMDILVLCRLKVREMDRRAIRALLASSFNKLAAKARLKQ